MPMYTVRLQMPKQPSTVCDASRQAGRQAGDQHRAIQLAVDAISLSVSHSLTHSTHDDKMMADEDDATRGPLFHVCR